MRGCGCGCARRRPPQDGQGGARLPRGAAGPRAGAVRLRGSRELGGRLHDFRSAYTTAMTWREPLNPNPNPPSPSHGWL
eukprot:4276608-Prymnesium_polylepis.1